MAEEPVQGASDDAGPSSGKNKKSVVVGGIIVGVMLIEGVGLYAMMKLLGSGPEQAAADEGLVSSGAEAGDRPEIPVVKMKVPNRLSGKTYVYDIEVAATLIVPEGKEPEPYAKEIIKKIEKHENGIRDRLGYLVRSTKPDALDEPGLVRIRRQIKEELGKVLGDEKLFDQILLPRWMPLRADM